MGDKETQLGSELKETEKPVLGMKVVQAPGPQGKGLGEPMGSVSGAGLS